MRRIAWSEWMRLRRPAAIVNRFAITNCRWRKAVYVTAFVLGILCSFRHRRGGWARKQSRRPLRIQSQTTEILGRIEETVDAQNLSLGDLCRTFMFMPGTIHRPGYGEARKKVYHGIFPEDEFPPNSGIYIPTLGPRYVAALCRHRLSRREESCRQSQSQKGARFFFSIDAVGRLAAGSPGRMRWDSIARWRTRTVSKGRSRQRYGI